jgi:hypothetical protein
LDAAFLKIRPRVLGRGRFHETLMVKVGGFGVDGDDGLRDIVALPLNRASFGLRQRDSGAARQGFERVKESRFFILHDKGNRVTSGPATKTVVDLFVRTHHERGGLFGMERAAGLEVAARPFERNIRSDQLDDVAAVEHVGDDLIRIKLSHFIS